MKEKLKKFHAKHKREIEWFCYGVTAGSLLGLWAVQKTENGMKLADANLYHDEKNNIHILKLDHANGKSESYLWDPNRTE